MGSAHVHWLAACLQLGYYAKGEVMLSPDQGEALKLFIIKQGVDFSNLIDPDTLNALDRRILKESFRLARKLQKVLKNYFTF